ncbi:protein DGCR6 isoform X2 [Phyllopteryx taeniolatus]|uniref:protein DGCR6 isoform X2 n=1 Tax=Phyllopteryx taeniolatus TaxID=161469 RepID=UPI002AD3F46E|nr:protein DGCR6 isoform X2 [Phyllopteryx taeniolatus]
MSSSGPARARTRIRSNISEKTETWLSPDATHPTLTELERICREEWEKMPQNRCAKLTERYPRRLETVIAAKALKQDIARKHKEALLSCKSHNLALLKTNQLGEQEALEIRVREEQRMMDKKIVSEIDQKVTDQQNTLEKAGVPGFYITANPQELTMQMNLLELILKLQQKESQSGFI